MTKCAGLMIDVTGLLAGLLIPAAGRPCIDLLAALHCTTLHCTTVHCTTMHCTALHYNALHCTALHCTVETNISLYSNVCLPICAIFSLGPKLDIAETTLDTVNFYKTRSQARSSTIFSERKK